MCRGSAARGRRLDIHHPRHVRAHPARPRARPGAGSCVRHHGRCGAGRSRGRRHRRRAGRRQRHHRARLVRGAVRRVPGALDDAARAVGGLHAAGSDGQGGGAARRPRRARIAGRRPRRPRRSRASCCWPTRACCPRSSRAGKSASAERARAAAADAVEALGAFVGRRVRGERRACAGSCGRRLRLPAVHVRRRRREGARSKRIKLCTRAWLRTSRSRWRTRWPPSSWRSRAR